MLATDLFAAFRSEVMDTAKPYFWSDADVWRYMNDAYSMFVRLTGGVADSSSDLTRVDVVPGEAEADVSRKILKFRSARLLSNGRPLEIINHTDFPLRSDTDYGAVSMLTANTLPGPVRYMVIGQQRGQVSWVRIPEVADTVQLSVYRLPLATLSVDGGELDEVDEEHHIHLLLWMKGLAYDKHDADSFDSTRRDQNKQAFMSYCDFAKAEWERAKSKVRTVAYGGY